MTDAPITVKITKIMLILNGLFWLVFAVITAANLIPIGVNTILRWVMAVLAFDGALVLIGLAFLLPKHNRWIYFIGFTLSAMMAIVSLLDELGVMDIASFLFNLVILILLIKDRIWYIGSKKSSTL